MQTKVQMYVLHFGIKPTLSYFEPFEKSDLEF